MLEIGIPISKITTTQKSVTSRVLLTTPALNGSRRMVHIQNLGADQLYVGDSAVTTTGSNKGGTRLVTGEDVSFVGDVPIYGVSVGTSDVRIQEGE